MRLFTLVKGKQNETSNFNVAHVGVHHKNDSWQGCYLNKQDMIHFIHQRMFGIQAFFGKLGKFATQKNTQEKCKQRVDVSAKWEGKGIVLKKFC